MLTVDVKQQDNIYYSMSICIQSLTILTKIVSEKTERKLKYSKKENQKLVNKQKKKKNLRER